MTFVAGATKISLKNLKTKLCLDDLQQSEVINDVVMKDLNLWQILAEVLLELMS